MSSSSNVRDAEMGAGLAVGLANAINPQQQASRAEARVRREQSMQALQQVKALKPTEADLANMKDTQSMQLQAAQEEARAAVNGLTKQSTMEAFRRYDTDGFNVKHINTMLRDLQGKNLFGGVTRVDALTEADRRMIEGAGLDAEHLLNDPEAAGSYVKTTTADGTQGIRSLDRLKAATGYTDYASEAELARQIRQKKLESIAMSGGGSTEIERTAYNIVIGEGLKPGTPEFATRLGQEKERLTRAKKSSSTRDSQAEREAARVTALAGYEIGTPEYNAAFQSNYEAIMSRKTGAGTEGEREAERAAQAAMAAGDKRPYETIYNEEFNAITKRKGLTSGQKEQMGAAEAQDALDELAGGDFFSPKGDFDMSSPRNRARIEPAIAAIEQGFGAELSVDERKTLQQINELTKMGGMAGELTSEQTGLIDRMFRSVKKYVSDNVEGVQAEAAYAGYRNTIRHALFGSVLTAGEQKSFIEQFGSLGQQAGPILAQLKTSLEQVKSNYETLVATNNPYVIQYRTGKTADELDDVISAIGERMDMIDNFSTKKISVAQPRPTTGGTVAISPEYRAKLDAIYAGEQAP